MTLLPRLAASIPACGLFHDITVAVGETPPSRISSQPMILRPRAIDEAFDTLHEIALQLVFVFEPLFGDPFLTNRTLLPARFRALVTAYVNILRREKRDHLVEHALHELKDPVVPGAENVVEDAPCRRHGIPLSAASQSGIGGQRGQRVSRHLDLGNDIDVAVGGITEHFAHVVRRVEHPLAVGLAVVFLACPGMPDDSLSAHGADLGKPRVSLDRQPPPLVVGPDANETY